MFLHNFVTFILELFIDYQGYFSEYITYILKRSEVFFFYKYLFILAHEILASFLAFDVTFQHSRGELRI